MPICPHSVLDDSGGDSFLFCLLQTLRVDVSLVLHPAHAQYGVDPDYGSLAVYKVHCSVLALVLWSLGTSTIWYLLLG
jgi:hypothetical protein